MIISKKIEEAKNKIRKSSEKPLIVLSQDDSFNRKIIEYGKFDILLSPERGNRSNSIRKINSGLNHVVAKIATKNKVSIGIDVDEIKKLSKKEKAERLSKVKQNIEICRKAKAKIIVISVTENKKNIYNFLISLGASNIQAKEATKSF